MGAAEENANNITRLQTQMENVQIEIGKIKKEQEDGFKEVLTKIDSLDKKYVRKEMYKKDMEDILEYMKEKKGKQSYIWQIATGTIIGILITTAIDLITDGILHSIPVN